MASHTIYPPLVNSYEPAFIAGSDSSLRVYFSLSSLSNIPVRPEYLTLHAQIYRQDGIKVLNTTNDTTDPNNFRYRATGIILNLKYTKVEGEDNLYYISIKNSDLKSSVTFDGTTYNGWIPGWIYKIQLRLSSVTYDPNSYPKQEVWLQEFSDFFSEWSTICYTKAISPMRIKIPLFNYDSGNLNQQYSSETIYTINEMNFFGTIESEIFEANEDFKYVKISLYDNETLLEESGEIYRTEQSNSYFSYNFKYNLQDDFKYTIFLDYETENGFVPREPLKFNFIIEAFSTDTINAQLITIDKNYNNLLTDLTSLDEEEDEGRIVLKIYSPSTNPWSGNICIRRASQEDNFQTWDDITIFTVREKDLNTLDLIYDYTIESGKWYKYSIQSIDKKGVRGKMVIMGNPIQRLFNYSYILGQDCKQLKLQFNNTLSSFKHQIYDSKIDTIGSQYPFITRNAAVNYRTFPINTLISFWMDENNTFLKNGKKDIYTYSTIVKLYDNYVENDSIRKQYDYTYERDFRKMVLDFLQDGKPKLFKSPTEGNIIVRLMDVNCTPNQTLDRMIYSISMNAHEIDDNTMDNYLKYGFYNVGSYSTYFGVKKTYLGQIMGSFTSSDNIIKKIYEKYDSQGKNYGGYSKTLEDIQRLKITINGYYYIDENDNIVYTNDNNLRVYNNQNDLVIGNNILFSNNGGADSTLITIYSSSEGVYEFDDLIKFNYNSKSISNDSLYLLGDAENTVTAIDATIDFLYTLTTENYEKSQIQERKPIKGLGQFYDEVHPGDSIFNIIYYQHYINSDSIFKYLDSITDIEIEANPHTVFAIKDSIDSVEEYHEINDTGILRLSNLSNIVSIKYIGKRYLKVPYDDNTLSEEIITEDILDENNNCVLKASADVSLTYKFIDIQGTYRISM